MEEYAAEDILGLFLMSPDDSNANLLYQYIFPINENCVT